jgi:hypothetical protein
MAIAFARRRPGEINRRVRYSPRAAHIKANDG